VTVALIDTNIVSAFMRGNPQVIRKIEDYLQKHDQHANWIIKAKLHDQNQQSRN
jgi:hypothetical protein